MSNKKKRKTTPVEDDNNITTSQKDQLNKLGLKPYRTYRGKIKWLSDDQNAYENVRHSRKGLFLYHKAYKPKRHRRRRFIKNLLRFMERNWGLIILFVLLLLYIIFFQTVTNFLINFEI